MSETNWQDIDSAPKDWTHVLVADEFGNVLEAYFHTEYDEWVHANQAPEDEGALVDTPTHWMPLPAPPEVSR